jgi:hypothetical protein
VEGGTAADHRFSAPLLKSLLWGEILLLLSAQSNAPQFRRNLSGRQKLSNLASICYIFFDYILQYTTVYVEAMSNTSPQNCLTA